ncbi:hypothetical protein KEJ51_06910 [Candidatus Bathyarchaeota archaeon]|nr:hypothetical protein [Candidatus Bathyarchaeota archaeon]
MVNLKVLVASVIMVAALTYFLVSLPLLYYDIGFVKRPCIDGREIDLYGPTVFVSDLHISNIPGDSERLRALAIFVKDRGVSNLVILGDLFRWRSDWDSFKAWYGSDEKAVEMVLETIGVLGQELTVYLVLGDPSHDPEELNVNFKFGHTKFLSLGKCGIFHAHGLTIIGLHGDQAFGGPIGFAVSIVTRNLLLERIWKAHMNIPPGFWVIMGHTHIPGIDHDAKVANTGGWTDIPFNIAPRAKAVIVDEKGRIDLVNLKFP